MPIRDPQQPTDVYTLLIFHETHEDKEDEGAYKVGATLDDRHAGVWIAKSQIEVKRTHKEREGGFEVKDIEVPDWLAENAGLV